MHPGAGGVVGLLCRRWRYSSQYPHRRHRRCTTPTATVQGRSHLSYVGLTSLAGVPSRRTRAQVLRAPTLPGLAACLVHWARGRGRSRLARCRPCADVFAILPPTALRATGLPGLPGLRANYRLRPAVGRPSAFAKAGLLQIVSSKLPPSAFAKAAFANSLRVTGVTGVTPCAQAL